VGRGKVPRISAIPAGPVLALRKAGELMTTLERCLKFLDDNYIRYAHTQHSQAFTALDFAFSEHISAHKLAKTIVYASAQGYGFAVLPADCVIDLATLGRFLNDPVIRLAGEAELAELFPSCEVGAMPPFGTLFQLPVIVDASIEDNEFITFKAGTHRDVIHMATEDFIRLADPAIAQ